LLVRPDGATAYYAAWAALRSWGSDFGYELIEADWELAYPPADPALAATVREAVAGARVRQERIAAAAPRQYASRARPEYRVSHGPGGVVLDGPLPGGDGGYRAGGTTGRFADGWGGSSGDGRTTGGAAGGAAGEPPGGPGGSAGPAAAPGSHGGNGGGGATGGGADGGQHGAPGEGDGIFARSVTSNRYAPDGTPLDQPGPGQPGGSSAGSNPEGGSAEHFGGAPGGTAGSAPGTATGGTSGSTAGTPAGGTPAGAAGGATGGGTMLQFGEWRPSGPTGGGAPSDSTTTPPATSPTNPATGRGENWGLPEAGRGAVPITRPILLECHPDRLVVLPEQGTIGGQTIPLGARMDGSLDTLVSAVWSRMQSWGMAGAGMYWRPILRVRVAPGAEPRFEELKRLLAGSGLVVE
jgi:hypothetical protein